MRAAEYPLETVWPLIPPACAGAEPKFNTTKSTNVVSDKLDMSLSDAKNFIYDAIRSLTPDNYCRTLPDPPPPADWYGLEIRRIGWYVKFKVLTPPRLEVCGFHPPERPFRTRDGTTIK